MTLTLIQLSCVQTCGSCKHGVDLGTEMGWEGYGRPDGEDESLSCRLPIERLPLAMRTTALREANTMTAGHPADDCPHWEPR